MPAGVRLSKNVTSHGSPAKLMKTSFSPQPLATVAGEYPRSWGQEAEIINFAGDPLSCEQVQSDSPVYGS